jgi:NAD-dependent deacetylase
MKNHLTSTCAQIIRDAQRLLVLTGAGISTESGILDFRSRSGLYEFAPEYILSLSYFKNHPKEFYQFALENLYHPNAKPNKGHQILARWEQEGKIVDIITQNIDGLHQKAGSQHVIEFHGTMKTASCINCGSQYKTEELLKRMKEEEETFYVCKNCQTSSIRQRFIKPSVVLFGDRGEWFSNEGFQIIINKIERADCLLVLGTSLQVTPFSIFPTYRTKGTPMIIINKGNTTYDQEPNTYLIQDSIGNIMSELDAFNNS